MKYLSLDGATHISLKYVLALTMPWIRDGVVTLTTGLATVDTHQSCGFGYTSFVSNVRMIGRLKRMNRLKLRDRGASPKPLVGAIIYVLDHNRFMPFVLTV